MATADLQTFIEDRLLSLDPSMDISPGSPAQTEFITPLITYLGTDPFDTDIDKFLTDRLRQEYPDIYADDPSAVRDLFIKPLILFLEPFKREIQSLKRSQSLVDPTQLSDDDADALAANFFEERATGKITPGVVRAFYANPANVSVEATVRFSTADGLGFVPSLPTSFTAEEMVFNRSGALYYVDIPVVAEQEGSQYNIEAGAITSVDGLYGVVKVTNLAKFQDGVDPIPTPAFIAKTKQALNERSLNNRRGASARLNDVFPGQLRAVQVVGARDEEMQRDILVGRSPGHSWLTGLVTVYGSLAFVQALVVDDLTESAPEPGNTLYVYVPSIPQEVGRVLQLNIEEVLGPKVLGSTFQCGWLVRWSGSLPVGVNLSGETWQGGCRRRSNLTISSLPGIGKVDLLVQDQDVHVYGHSDIYIRPNAPDNATASLSNVVDAEPFVEKATLRCPSDASNAVTDDTVGSFETLGVLPGDVLTVESGDNAGVYTVGFVVGGTIYTLANFAKAASGMRYRISKHIRVNPFDPRIPKLPFGSATAEDLSTQIGSTLFTFSVSTVDFGAAVGDQILVKSGLSAGQSFTIMGFDGTLGGRGVIVDRAAVATESGLSYEIYTPLEPVQKPLVRIKELLLLDSAQKSTGITIPPADPVAVVPTSDFTTAKVLGQSYLPSGFVLPAMSSVITLVNGTAASAGVQPDDRFSRGLDSVEDGYFKTMRCPDGTDVELLFPGDSLDSCSYFLATVEDDSPAESFPPIDPQPGYSLFIKNGPNKGGYAIKGVRKWKYRTGSAPNIKTYWLYFIQIHGEFPVDVFSQLLQFFRDNGITATALDAGPFSFPSIFTDFFSSMGTKLSAALSALHASSTNPASLQAAAEALTSCEYEWGTPSRGVLRTYFSEPTLFQQNTAESKSPTVYEFTTESGEVIGFRAEPSLYAEHQVLPARGSGDAKFNEYPRDITTAGATATLGTSDKPTAFVLGITPDDVLAIHGEVFFDANLDRLYAVQTVANSPRIHVPAGSPFTPSMVGNLLAIEEGGDAGLYRITDFVDVQTVILDRPLLTSTPDPTEVLSSVSITVVGGGHRFSAIGWDGTSYIGYWVTFYRVLANVAATYVMGSYRITGWDGSSSSFDASNFPVDTTGLAYAVVTAAPPTAPVSDASTTGIIAGVGTKCYAVRPIRMYQDVPTELDISVVAAVPGLSQFSVNGTLPVGTSQPYRILRRNIRRVNPLEMGGLKDGPLFYFDTEVLSLVPHLAANITRDSYLVPKEGTFYSEGYRHEVEDYTLSFSMKEEGILVLPLRVLPPFALDRLDNTVNVAGAPVQISYERSDVVANAQQFVDSAEDRITSANQLVRHFVPAYFSYDATYVGGSSTDVVAQDIINYVNSLAIETPIDVSVIESLISRRGGNVITPTKVLISVLDWDRRAWVEFSENQVGGLSTNVPYHGSPRVTYFVPGSDESMSVVQGYGERIKLTRL